MYITKTQKKISSVFSPFPHENGPNLAAQIKNHFSNTFPSIFNDLCNVISNALIRPAAIRINTRAFIICPTVNTKGPVTAPKSQRGKPISPQGEESQEACWLSKYPSRRPPLGYRSRFTRARSVPCLTGALLGCIFCPTQSIA